MNANTETQAVLDWVLKLIDGYMLIEETSLSDKHPMIQELQDLYLKVNGNADEFAESWVVNHMKQEFGFDGNAFNIWTHPENYIFDQIQFVAVLLRLGLERVDWHLIGMQMKERYSIV